MMPGLSIRPDPGAGAPPIRRRPPWRAARGAAAGLAALALVLAACGGAAAPSSAGSGTGSTGGPSAASTPTSAEPSTAGSSSLDSPGAATGTPLASSVASPEASGTPPVPSGTPPVPSGTPARATVVMRDLAFSPTVLNITTGTTVVFSNEDTVGHMPALGQNGVAATNPFFAPIDLPVGATATVVFSAPGTYPITCLIHPAMNMTITVR
jgi:plastocyanin